METTRLFFGFTNTNLYRNDECAVAGLRCPPDSGCISLPALLPSAQLFFSAHVIWTLEGQGLWLVQHTQACHGTRHCGPTKCELFPPLAIPPTLAEGVNRRSSRQAAFCVRATPEQAALGSGLGRALGVPSPNGTL